MPAVIEPPQQPGKANQSMGRWNLQFRVGDHGLEVPERQDVVICELMLVEVYLKLRNPAIIRRPLDATAAAAHCQAFRKNPHWHLVEGAPVMEEVWRQATSRSFAVRRIIDARLALTLRHHGVTEFATTNRKDFVGFGFTRVWNPLNGNE